MAIVQRHDPDRFACLLFAPPAARETLATLYAFNHELARAREVASQPPLALIRLRWWQEVVEGANRAHPVARAVSAALAAGRLNRDALDRMVEARMREADDIWDDATWFAYLRDTGGLLMREAARVSTTQLPEALDLLALGAGVAAVGLLRNRAAHATQGRVTFPQGRDAAWVAAEARLLLGPARPWPEKLVAATLPVLLARRWLTRLARNPAGLSSSEPPPAAERGPGLPRGTSRPAPASAQSEWWRVTDRCALWVAARRRLF